MSRFRAIMLASLRDMWRSRTLRVVSSFILFAPIPATWWLRTSNSTADLISRASAAEITVVESTPRKGMIVSMLLLFTIYIFILACGSLITTSVALERTSRVSILVFRHVSPLVVVIAKLAALIVAMLGIVAGLALETTVINILNIVPLSGLLSILGLTSLSGPQQCLVLLCVISGVAIFSMLYAAVGLFVRESAQLQYAQLPVSFVLILVFSLSYTAVLNPSSMTATIAAWFPLSAPMVESGRIISGSSSIAEGVGSAAGVFFFLITTAVLIARIIVPRTAGCYRALNLTGPLHRRAR